MRDEHHDRPSALKPFAEGIAIIALASAVIAILLTVQQIIFRDMLVFFALMFAPLIVLAAVIWMISDGNPLKRLLTALNYRVGATATAGMVAIPIEPLPGLDAIYDIVVPLALIWYWFIFFRDAFQMSRSRRR
jgi:FtsH-binding integral membrane protein